MSQSDRKRDEDVDHACSMQHPADSVVRAASAAAAVCCTPCLIGLHMAFQPAASMALTFMMHLYKCIDLSTCIE